MRFPNFSKCNYTHTHTHTHTHTYIYIYIYIYIQQGFATVRFTTIYFYDPCQVGPSTPELWCITVAIQPSHLYLLRFKIFYGVHLFLVFLFQCSSFKFILIFPPMTSITKTEKKKKSKQLTLNVFLTSSEPPPESSSAK